ncbi:MAG TPA: cysteine desulfurase family protein, partial [Sphingomicrobium sp.]|nr:cysteine desulfurase family protein [Sphingomicrobium sp.]
MIYLDYQATTPVAPEVAEAMKPWITDRFANPHSPSRWGREAEAAIAVARKQVGKAIGRKGGSVAFTGTATEAINWAIKGTVENATTGRNRIVTIATEHAAVLDTCEWLAGTGIDLTLLPVQADGLVDLDDLQRELDERVLLVAAMAVNNEIGVCQPVDEIARRAHQVGALMLCDAVQAFGRVDMPDRPDLIAVSAHKIHGPKGIGALWMREGAEPATFVHGGGQEQGMRSGTLSPALCVGFGAAAQLATERWTRDHDHVHCLWAAALSALGPEWTVNGSVERRYRGNLNIRKEGVDAARLLA